MMFFRGKTIYFTIIFIFLATQSLFSETLQKNQHFDKNKHDINHTNTSESTTRPELSIQEGPSSPVKTIAYSPDGSFIASGSEDGIIKLWDAKDDVCIRTFTGHMKSIHSVSFSPDSRHIVSCGSDRSVKIWNIAESRCKMTLTGHTGSVFSAVYSSCGKYIASGSEDGTIRLWDAKTGGCTKILDGMEGSVFSLAFSPDGKTIASGTYDNAMIIGKFDNVIKIWDINKGICIKKLAGHEKYIKSVFFSSDGNKIFSGSNDGTIRIWDVKEEKELNKFNTPDKELERANLSPDGKYIVSISCNGYINIWDINKNTCIFSSTVNSALKINPEKKISLYSLTYSPDGKHILTGNSLNQVNFWEAPYGKYIKSISPTCYPVLSVAFSPDGKYLAVGSRDRAIRIWNTENGSNLRTFWGHAGKVNSVAFSKDGNILASAGNDQTIRLWDVKSGKLKMTLSGHTDIINSVTFSKDSKCILSGSNDKTARIWEIDSGKCIKILKAHKNYIHSVAYSPDGKSIASGSADKTIILWEPFISDYPVKIITEDKCIFSVCFSPDGKTIASAGRGNNINIWEASSGKKLKMLRNNEGDVYCAAFSPDGKTITSAGNDLTIKIWDVSSGLCRSIMKGHTYLINSVTYSPDGKFIASGSFDKTIKLWRTDNGEQIISIISFYDGNWVMYKPEGYFDCSEGGKKYLEWVIGLRHYSFEHFIDEFYIPFLLTSLLENNNHKNKRDLRSSLAIPPEVKILVPGENTDKEVRNISVKVIAKDIGGGIKDIGLYHQGKLITGGIEVNDKETKTVMYKVTLLAGKNHLRATAFNGDHTVESNSAEAIYDYKSTEEKKPGVFILATGINKYKDSRLDLQSAKEDAQCISQAFKGKGASLFGDQTIVTLLDEEATKSRIIEELTRIKDKAKQEDVVIVFFSGHGDVDPSDGQYYFIPYDFSTKGDIENMYKASGVSALAIGELTKAIKAGKILLVFDTCHSGKATSAFRSMAEIKAMKMLAKSVGLHILAATKDEQLAGEDTNLGHGIFTYAIIEGLDGKADSDKDGIITVRELLPYVEQRVETLSNQYTGRAQYPVADSRGMDFPLVIFFISPSSN